MEKRKEQKPIIDVVVIRRGFNIQAIKWKKATYWFNVEFFLIAQVCLKWRSPLAMKVWRQDHMYIVLVLCLSSIRNIWNIPEGRIQYIYIIYIYIYIYIFLFLFLFLFVLINYVAVDEVCSSSLPRCWYLEERSFKSQQCPFVAPFSTLKSL